jgi:hypothetical protein
LPSRKPELILAGVAILLLAPSLLVGTMLSHSSPHNLTWADQFSEQFRDFILYPRWMPDSFLGLGGPAFYFYPPLAFWVDSLLSVVTFNTLSLSYRLSLTWLVILWASGLAMHAWLRQQTGNDRIALWGAIAYMAAPYHLLDHYLRGAFAEFTVYVFLPLVLLSIRRPVLLAFSYAGLVASHLPVALLISVTVLPAYLLFRLRKPVEWLGAAAGGLLGLGLAAIYLLPALTLQRWISADQFWTQFYQIENWYLLAYDLWPEAPVMYIVTSLAVAWGILALGICLFFRKRGEAFFWGAVALASFVLMTGLFPWFWQLPELAKVQFPYRLLVVVEFAVITACCHVRPRLQRGPVYLFTLALFAAVPGLSLAGLDIRDRVNDVLGKSPLIFSDVMEYEPRGFRNDLGIGQIKDVPEISCIPAARLCRAESRPFGAMQIEIESETATEVTLRRFFFPAWRLDNGLPLAPTEPLQLVSFKAPPGRTSVALSRVALPVEPWAWAISGLSLALLLAWAVVARRRAKRA